MFILPSLVKEDTSRRESLSKSRVEGFVLNFLFRNATWAAPDAVERWLQNPPILVRTRTFPPTSRTRMNLSLKEGTVYACRQQLVGLVILLHMLIAEAQAAASKTSNVLLGWSQPSLRRGTLSIRYEDQSGSASMVCIRWDCELFWGKTRRMDLFPSDVWSPPGGSLRNTENWLPEAAVLAWLAFPPVLDSGGSSAEACCKIKILVWVRWASRYRFQNNWNRISATSSWQIRPFISSIEGIVNPSFEH